MLPSQQISLDSSAKMTPIGRELAGDELVVKAERMLERSVDRQVLEPLILVPKL